ncbi:Gfo/Idh/MocA family protein [candidate division KSB1 bacterium]
MKNEKITRRNFIKSGTAAAAVVAGFPFVQTSRAQSVKPLKIGVIGFGGRGRGAADNALTSAPDIHLVAVADPFRDRIDEGLKVLTDPKRREGPLKGIDVKEDHIFTGLYCHDKLLETDVDYVCLTGPPGFRPMQFEAAIKAGKHVFMEKPVATDPVGIRKILKTAKLAEKKGLSVVVGFNFRHHVGVRETIDRIRKGQMGEVLTARSYFNTGTLWHRGEDPSWTEMEYQCRNWYYYCWLSGDHIVEQHIHYIDLTNWVMGGYPVKALSVGGREVRTDPKFGNIYDHFAVDYEFSDDRHALAMCRQTANCDNLTGTYAVGTKGKSPLREAEITGQNPWKYNKEVVNPQVYEHWELIESIRNGKPLNEAENGAYSTLTAIMGRESAYTGKAITWEEILNSDLDLFPKNVEFGPVRNRAVPIPGEPRPI